VDIRKLRFRVSGGFAGVIRGTEVDGSALDAGERRALLAHAHDGSARDSHARDAQVYAFEMDTSDGPVRIEFDDNTLPEDLAALVDRLSAASGPIKGK